jgi:exodeoxyribonuclease-1
MREDWVAHDTETSGLDVRHDQIVQYAAVRSAPGNPDPVETLDIRIRLLPYAVPSPQAMAVTGNTIRSLLDPSLPTEFEAARTVHRFLRPARDSTRLILSYNGSQFDSEMLRTFFWRNLLDPWVMSGQQVRQVDLLRAVQAAHFLQPGCIRQGSRNGSPTWRLESLAPENGIDPGRSHDALSDAKATLALGALLKERAPLAWSLSLGNSDIRGMSSILRSCGTGPVWLFSHFGEPELRPAYLLGRDQRRLVMAPADDRLADLVNLEPREIADLLYAKDSPLKVVTPKSGHLLIPRDAGWLPSPTVPMPADWSRLISLLMADTLRERVQSALSISDVRADAARPPRSSEERIYSGFASDSEKRAMAEFHAAQDWLTKASLSVIGRNPALNEMAARLVAVHAGHDPDVRSALAAAWKSRGLDPAASFGAAAGRPWADERTAPWRTLEAARRENSESPSPDVPFGEWLDTMAAMKPEPAARGTPEPRGPAVQLSLPI